MTALHQNGNGTILESGRSNNTRNSSYNIRTLAHKEVNQLSRSMMLSKKETKVSLTDMVNSSKKCNDNFGIAGYEFGRPLHPSFPEKPTSYNKAVGYSISKDSGKPMDFISML